MAITPITPEIDNRDHTQLLQEAGMMVLMGDIGEETIKPVIEWLLVENHVTKKKKKDTSTNNHYFGGNTCLVKNRMYIMLLKEIIQLCLILVVLQQMLICL